MEKSYDNKSMKLSFREISTKQAAVSIGINIWENRFAFFLKFNMPVTYDSAICSKFFGEFPIHFHWEAKIRFSSYNICKRHKPAKNLDTYL